MFVRSLRLHNFRNYALQDLILSPGLIAFTGDNGQGKTNLLEALCVLAATKSPLVDRDRELLRWDCQSARLEAEVQLSHGRGERRRLAFEWKLEGQTLKRDLRVGGVPQSALASWLGQLQVVAFFPHDLNLISGEPEGRRRFLNLELGKTRPLHFADAARYRRALQQRNALLKFLLDRKFRRSSATKTAASTSGALENGAASTSAEQANGGLGTLGEWNKQVTVYGARIWQQRRDFLEQLAPLLENVHRELSGIETPLSIQHVVGLTDINSPQNGVLNGEKAWQNAFERALEFDYDHDRRRGTTQSGPHRDDLIFRLGDMDLRRFGSQGQARLAVLSLKIALAQWVQNATGEAPILLLDDALSELDATRRARVLQLASGFEQAIITATDAEFLHSLSTQNFAIQGGQVLAPAV